MQAVTLWDNVDFNRLWFARSVSLMGTQVTVLALPLTAAIILNASPLEMGILGASAFAPYLMFGLFAGVLIDHRHRRSVMIAADLGRAALLTAVPIMAILGVLRIEFLILIQLLIGTMDVLFDVAHEAYLPSLVPRDNLIEGNSKIEFSRAIAFVGGPSLAGVLAHRITPPFAILANVLSFLASAYSLSSIKSPEHFRPKANSEPLGKQIAGGLRFLLENNFLRPIVTRAAAVNLFDRIMQAVYVLYVTRELMVQPVVLGFLLSMIGMGALVGTFAAGRLAQRIGIGQAIVSAAFLGGSASLLFPLASGPHSTALPLLAAGHFFLGMSHPIFNINQLSLRQVMTPDHLRGRVSASLKFLTWGPLPIGWLMGGVLGELIGLRPTLFIGAVGVMTATLLVIMSPLRTIRDVSDLKTVQSQTSPRI